MATQFYKVTPSYTPLDGEPENPEEAELAAQQLTLEVTGDVEGFTTSITEAEGWRKTMMEHDAPPESVKVQKVRIPYPPNTTEAVLCALRLAYKLRDFRTYTQEG